MSTSWFDKNLQNDLYAVGTVTDVAAGTTIIREGEKHGHCFIILDGKVHIWAPGDPFIEDSMNMVLLDTIGAVDLIGELSAIDGEPHAATVETATKVKLLRFSSSCLPGFMHKYPALEEHIMKRLCRQIRLANDKISEMRTLPSNARITRELIRLAKKTDDNGKGVVINDFPTHAVLAARCGVTRETASRTIGNLIKQGLLVKTGNTVTINDSDALARAYEDADKKA